MVKAWLAALVALVVILIAYPLLSPSASGLTQDQAKEYVLEDLKPLTSQGVEARFVNAEKTDGRFAVDVLLSRNAHSACPSVEKRFYTLLPISFRSETVVQSCTEKVQINYREQALIQAAAKVDVGFNPYGCAFFGNEYKQAESRDYCQILDESKLDAFSADLPSDAWLVQWSNGKLVALSKNGDVLKTA